MRSRRPLLIAVGLASAIWTGGCGSADPETEKWAGYVPFGGATGVPNSNSTSGSGGASGSAGPAGSAGSTHTSGGTSGSAGQDNAGGSSGGVTPALLGREWAHWPMPNGANEGLPNPAQYTSFYALGLSSIVVDEVTGLVWSLPHSDGLTMMEARLQCEQYEYDGHSDWRLPTRIELLSIVDYTAETPPRIDVAFAPNSAQRDWYWTSSYDASGTTGRAWAINFDGGACQATEVDEPHFSRCVRGDQRTAGHYLPAADASVGGSVVEDTKTQLIWQAETSALLFSWTEAQSHCAELGKPWRLPTVKELLTLVDVTRFEPAIDEVAFPNTASEGYWSSTPRGQPPELVAFHVDFRLGAPWLSEPQTRWRVRCVR